MRSYKIEFTEVERYEGLESKGQVLDHVWKIAKEILVKDGYLEPVLFLVRPKTVLFCMVGKMFASAQTKKDFVKFVRGLTSQPDVQGYVLVTEVWYFVGGEDCVIRPSEHPSKKEALLMQSEWVDGEVVRRSAEICRNGDQILLKDFEMGSGVDGNLCNLMAKKADQ